MNIQTGTLTVFYDASCPRCVKDRAWYENLNQDTDEQVHWFDITGQDEHLRRLGIDPYAALTELHVQDSQGQIHRELDAYILLLARIPRLRWLAWLIGLPGLRQLLAWLYHAWVERRLRKSGRI